MKLLFDLDNTLTPPRQKINTEMKQLLFKICEKHQVGIITGSGIDYLQEQLGKEGHMNMILFPCNGTQEHQYIQEDRTKKNLIGYWKHIRRNQLSGASFDICRRIQRLKSYDKWYAIGDQIQKRDSLINFCPIGRDASIKVREQFIQFDNLNSWRKKKLKALQKIAKKHNYVATLGGQTSFDIYPQGWDKSYSLKYFFPDLYFGDAFNEGQNDYCMIGKIPCVHVANSEQTLVLLQKLFPEVK